MARIVRPRRQLVDDDLSVGEEKHLDSEDADKVEGQGRSLAARDRAFRLSVWDVGAGAVVRWRILAYISFSTIGINGRTARLDSGRR